MVKVILYGKMVEDIRVNMLIIKNKDMDNLYGRMEEVIKDNGRMVNKMGGEYLKIEMGYRKQGYGVMVERLNGLVNKNKKEIWHDIF